MKKLLLLLVVVVLVFAVFHRQRLYVHDPLASVTRNGVAEQGTQVMINYGNDVLLEHDGAPRFATLLQHGQPVGTPRRLQCLHFVGCMTEADEPPVLVGSRAAKIVSMSVKKIVFLDDEGREAVILLY